MQDDILISVIIPTYNSKKYILKTLKSVYRQNVLPYEIVVCDDGSEDNTVQLVESYFEKHSGVIGRTRIIRQKNKGAGAARNNAIRNTTGNWIAFLDSDDAWYPDKLEKVIRAIRKNDGIGIISHNEYAVIENKEKEPSITKYNEIYDPKNNLYIQLFQRNFFSTSCMVVRKDFIVKAGYMDEGLLSAQDYDLWLRVSRGQDAYIIDEPLAYYLMRDGNISSNTYRRYLCELKIIKKNRREVCKVLGRKNGKKMIIKKVLEIHLAEGYSAIRNRQFGCAVKIGRNLLPVLGKMRF